MLAKLQHAGRGRRTGLGQMLLGAFLRGCLDAGRQIRPNLANFGPLRWPKPGAATGRFRSNLARLGPHLVKRLPIFVEVCVRRPTLSFFEHYSGTFPGSVPRLRPAGLHVASICSSLSSRRRRTARQRFSGLLGTQGGIGVPLGDTWPGRGPRFGETVGNFVPSASLKAQG